MTRSYSQADFDIATQQIQHRVESLGLTPAWVDPQGGAVILDERAVWIEQIIVGCPQFKQSLHCHLDALWGPHAQPVEVWHGVWLIPLVAAHIQKNGDASAGKQPKPVVLALTDEWLRSEWLSLLCDQQQLDRQATITRIDRSRLVTQTEVKRLAGVLNWVGRDAAEMQHQAADLKQLSRHLGEAYEELSLLHQFTTSMTVDNPPDRLLAQVCKDLQQVVGLSWVAMTLDDSHLSSLAGQLFKSGQYGCEGHVLLRIGCMLMSRFGRNAQPVIVDDTRTLDIPHLPRLGAQLLIVPLVYKGKAIGVIFGADKINNSQLSSVDTKLCASLGGSLAIYLQNALLYEDMQSMFLGTLHALTHSIDAKDSYTYGHSERVALVTKQLALAAGIDPYTAERAYLAGVIHDVGKIGVSESILCKAGPLTDREQALVRKHPEIGAKIVSDIRQMQDLVPGVLCHHERWDGQGYPRGLSGQNIPMLGRLISLADAFDAMSSNRSYRRPVPHQQALEEISRYAGTQFDPQLAEIFVQLDFKAFFEMLHEHQSSPNILVSDSVTVNPGVAQ